MNKSIIIAIIVVSAISIYFLNSGGDNEAYVQEILDERKEKDQDFRNSEDSPIIDKTSFNGLNYFPVDPTFRVTAVIEKIEKKPLKILKTSDGKTQQYKQFAYAKFKLSGQRYKLLLLKPAGFGDLDVIFTAFADNTSGEETYGGGRYLDLDFKNARQIKLDFNKAYNPYCEYNSQYSCPLPPPENILPISIKAGEKKYSSE